MKKLLLLFLLLAAMTATAAVEPTYFDAGGLKYQYFDGVNYYIGGGFQLGGPTIPKIGDVCIVAPNPDYTGTDLVIPETVPYGEDGHQIKVVGIAPEAFKGNQTITSVTFPNFFPETSSYLRYYNGATGKKEDVMGKNMFEGCSNLRKIVLSEGTEYVKFTEPPFKGCPIAEVDIPQTLTKLDNLLANSAVETIDIPDWVTEISFRECEQLREVPALPGMTEVPEFCFYGCNSLVNVEVPVNAIKIVRGAFQLCANLESVVISDKVETLGQAAFASCPKLDKVTVGAAVKVMGSSVFQGSDAITEIEFKPVTAPIFQEVGNPTATAATAHIFDQEVLDNAVATVPDGSLPSYRSQGWFSFAHAQDATTGVGDITVGINDVPVRYFNLQGIEVDADALVPGIYIKNQGNSTTKIAIR